MARRPSNRQQFHRTDRISEVVREVVATELERLDDERLDLVTVTAVDVDADLNTAKVYYSALTAESRDGLDDVVEALEEARWPSPRRVNSTVRARKTPQISFLPDDVLRSALRIEDLLAGRRDPDVEE
jgi:ribosome-binding factor A